VGDLLAKVESLYGNVSASLDSRGRLLIVDNNPGASSLAVSLLVKNAGGTDDGTLRFAAGGDLGTAASLRKRELVAGADAALTVDGVAVTHASNTISDVIGGVTLNLLKADPDTTVALTVGRDSDALVNKVKAFVASYNAVSGYIRTQGSYDTTTQKTGGLLFGDNTLSSVKSDLTSLLIRGVWGVSGDFSILGQVGVNVDTQGQLAVNEGLLRGYLNTNFNDVLKLFSASGESDTGALSYISHGRLTQAGDHAVHIETAATRSATAPSDATALAGDETLTITAGSQSAVIALGAGMSMAQIVTAINSELATVPAQTLAGSAPLYADAGQAAPITAATRWNSLYSGAGAAANLADGDVIAFAGTTRSGAAVSGAYTIADLGADSVQGLLTAIETAFGNQVTAAISDTGQISVTDKTAGTSSLALSFDLGAAHDLDFGTVATDNPGGQAGRPALAITASADAGGHLVLTHDSYGSSYGFTIRQANDLLWSGGDQTADNGRDVAGTINGIAATGSGQVLTGSGEGAAGNGLVIKYTGTAEGAEVGTLRLTLGVAELYDRALFNITDAFEGYVAFKQESLKNSAKGYQKQIDEMEVRLAAKQERMINRFVQMELAIQRIQSQSNWLAGQLTAAGSGWWNGK
jgi:flagellar hook-associated protein 2